MSDKIEELRSLFSKGNLKITSDGISAIYPSGTRFEQGITDCTYKIFANLLSFCDSFRINIKKSIMSYKFSADTGVEIPIIYTPIERQLSIEEYLEISRESNPPLDGSGERLAEFFDGVSLDDDEQVLCAFRDFLESTLPEHELSIPEILNYEAAVKKAMEFSSIVKKCFVSEFCGFISFAFYSDCEICGKSKDILADLVLLCRGCDLIFSYVDEPNPWCCITFTI